VPVSGVFDTVSAAWATDTVNVNVVGALVASRKPGDAAFVAVTPHVLPSVAFNEVPLTEHAVPGTVKVTSPVPDPPDVVNAIAVPIVPVSDVFDTVNVSCATEAASPRITGAAPSAAVPPHPARSITAHAMTASAAFPLPERAPNAPKRLLRALIEGRASPGLSPIIVHVPSGYWVPDPSTTV
jgi:hypothetical protein